MNLTRKGKLFLISLLGTMFLILGLIFWPFNTEQANSTSTNTYQETSQVNKNWNAIEVSNPTDTIATVEFGSTGYKAFVFSFNKNQLIPHLLYERYNNDNVLEGSDNPKEFVTRLSSDIKLFINKLNVSGKNIHLKFSSGFMNSPMASNIIKLFTDKGYVCEINNIRDEGKYGGMTAVPPAYRNVATYADIGGSNTKGVSWINDGAFTCAYDFGSKSLQKKYPIDKYPNFLALYRKEVKENMFQYFSNNPMATDSDLLFLGGGASYIASNLIMINPADFQEIKMSQITVLIDSIYNNWDSYKNNPVYSHVINIYNRERLLAGLCIIEGIYNHMVEHGMSPVTVIFTRVNNWAIGKSMYYHASLKLQ